MIKRGRINSCNYARGLSKAVEKSMESIISDLSSIFACVIASIIGQDASKMDCPTVNPCCSVPWICSVAFFIFRRRGILK